MSARVDHRGYLVFPAPAVVWPSLAPTWDWIQRLGRIALLDSALWTAASLAALPAVAAHLLSLPVDPRPSAVIFASGLLIYNLDHYADSYREAGSAEQWKGGIGRTCLAALVLASALLLAALLWTAPAAVGRVVVGYGLVGVLYGLPVLPVRRDGEPGWLRLKDIPGLKAAIVAGSITLAAVGLPLAYQGALSWSQVAPVALFVWVLVVSNTLMCDVGDLRADLRTGVRTLPAMFGVQRTRMAVMLLDLFLLALYSWGWGRGMVGLHPEVLVSGALVVLYVLLVTEDTPKQLLSFCLDGCSFVPLLAALAMHGHLG